MILAGLFIMVSLWGNIRNMLLDDFIKQLIWCYQKERRISFSLIIVH